MSKWYEQTMNTINPMNDSHINYIAIINVNAYTINNINTNANTSS